MRRIDLEVAPDEQARVDVYVARHVPDLSRERVQGLIEAGQVTVNGRPIKASARVRGGDRISVQIPPPRPLDVPEEQRDIPILHEDEDLLVIVKPRGLLTHPVGARTTGTLVNALKGRCTSLSGINGVLRPGIVHRLDEGTSGLMVVARTDRAHRGLVELFRSRSVTKLYRAIVLRVPAHARGEIDAPIGRHPVRRNRMRVDPDRGRPAITRYEVLEAIGDGHALLDLTLLTGRTHQIRVHLSHIGHPVMGDRLYGAGPVPGLGGFALHSHRLAFAHPVTGAWLDFVSELPADMTGILEKLRRGRTHR